MEFVAIDVETANADMSSICQIGIALYEQGTLSEEWNSYIDPEDYFDGMNISIHGIDERVVKGAPTIPDVSNTIYQFLDNRTSVCHTHFDRVAVKQAFDSYELRHPNCDWLDSARVARRTWEEFAWRGYGLSKICAFLGYEFDHHDALEDAKAAAFILNAAMKKTGLDINGCIERVKKPIDTSKSSQHIDRAGDQDGPLYGEVLVFTGALRIPRSEAADMAAQLGCKVESRVTQRTTLLVVGDQDIKRLVGHEKSSKHRRAEALILEGQSIRILRETDFQQLAKPI